MDLQVRTNGVNLTEELRLYIARRARFAFDAFGDAVSWVRVRLEDHNGPKGGVDKSCRVTAMARPGLAVLVEAVDADEHAAVSRAVRRAADALRRALNRARRVRLRRLS
jgi:ribosome-associated translation inhibitor RaiA